MIMNVSEKNEEAFGLVLNEIAKSVLRTFNKSEHQPSDRIILGENDDQSIFVMGRILVGICDQESDRKIASGVSEILSASVLSLEKVTLRQSWLRCARNAPIRYLLCNAPIQTLRTAVLRKKF